MSTSAGLWERIKSAFQRETPKMRLTEAQVLAIAEAYLASRGDIPLRQPVGIGIVNEREGVLWHICDLAGMRGGNFHIHISDATGKIVKTWGTPM